jgi:hypothetical protein
MRGEGGKSIQSARRLSPVFRIGTPPTASPAGECVPPPLVPGWTDTLARGRGGGGSQFGAGDRHCGILGIQYMFCVVCKHRDKITWRDIHRVLYGVLHTAPTRRFLENI